MPLFFVGRILSGMRCRRYNYGEATGCRYSSPRHPIAPPQGVCGRGCAPVPNSSWGRGLSERSEFRSPNKRDRGKGTRAPMVLDPFAETKGSRRAGPKPRKSHLTSPINIGIPKRLRVVSPFNRRPLRCGASPRSPTCCVNVCAVRLAPRNTVCFPYRRRKVSMV